MKRSQIPAIAALVLLVLLLGAASARFPSFASPDVFINLLRDNAFLGVAAVGLTFVIISGGIDLSPGAVIAFVSTGAAWLIGRGMHPYLVIAACLLFGALFGYGQGALITAFKLPPFLVTLGGMLMARGAAFLISTESTAISHPVYEQMSRAKAFAPSVLLGAVLAAWLILTQRPFGRTIFAIGGSESSAELMGLPVNRSKRQVYMLCGFCAALAGVLMTVYTSSGSPKYAEGLELDAITVVVIGGTLLTGGVGSVFGTLVGLLIFGTIQQVIIFDGTLSSWWTRIVIGALLAVFLILQKIVERGFDLGQRGET